MKRKYRKWNKTKVIKELKRHGPNMTFEKLREVDYSLLNACIRYYRSFNNARLAAGLPIRGNSNPKPLPKDIEISPELGYVVGVILGDGFISFGRNRCVGLTTVDFDFALYFKRKLEKLTGLTAFIYSIEACKRFNKTRNKTYNYQKQYFVRLFSIKVCHILKKFVEDISWIYESDPEVKKMVLKGLWDSEGYISRLNTIGFSNSDPKIIELYENLCNEFEIKTKLVVHENHFEVRLLGKESKIKFVNLIGITIARKRERFLNAKLQNQRKFSAKEKEFIFKNYKYMTDDNIAKMLNRNYCSILHFRERNKLFKRM